MLPQFGAFLGNSSLLRQRSRDSAILVIRAVDAFGIAAFSSRTCAPCLSMPRGHHRNRAATT